MSLNQLTFAFHSMLPKIILSPQRKIAEVAARDLGLYETSRNRAPGIAKFWTATSYKEGLKDRQPWCAAGVCYWVQTADHETEDFNLTIPPTSASVAEILEWAQDPKNGCVVFTPKDFDKKGYYPQEGDLVIYLPNLSHIGVIAKDYAWDGFIKATEGNTNMEGSREGDGVYTKQRRANFAGFYVRLPAKQVVKSSAKKQTVQQPKE